MLYFLTCRSTPYNHPKIMGGLSATVPHSTPRYPTYLGHVEDQVSHCERESQLLWSLVASPLYQLQRLARDNNFCFQHPGESKALLHKRCADACLSQSPSLDLCVCRLGSGQFFDHSGG